MAIRRVIAVILGIVFLFVSWGLTFGQRIKDTAHNEDFYIHQVRKADLFNYFYDTVLPLALDQIKDQQTIAERKIDLSRLKPQIAAALRETFPPQWLEDQTEAAVREVAPYLRGSREQFTIRIAAADRIKASGPALKKAAQDGAVYNLVFDDLVTPAVKDAMADPHAVPFDLPLTQGDVLASLRNVASRAWFQAQLDAAVDALVPYLDGQAEHFTIRIPLTDRVEPTRAELKALMAKLDAPRFLFERVVDPMVDQQIGQNFTVPFAQIVTPQDVKTVMRETFTQDWVRARTSDLVDATVDYASGKTQQFSLSVSLTDRKPVAVASVGRLMDARLGTVYNAAPVCTAQQLQRLNIADFVRTGIVCKPPGVTLDQVKAAAGVLDYQGQVARLVDAAIPNTFVFSQAELRARIGEAQWSRLQDIRRWVRDGFTYTDADLEEALARNTTDGVKLLHETRDYIKRGTFTQDDLRQRMEDAKPGSYQDLSDVRGSLKGVRWLGVLAWVIPGILLTIVAVLGARSRWGKVLWGAAFLLVASFLLFLAAGPVYNGSTRDSIRDAAHRHLVEEAGPQTPLERAIAVKAEAVVVNASDEFFHGLAKRGLTLTIVAVVVGGGAVAWRVRERRRGAAPRST